MKIIYYAFMLNHGQDTSGDFMTLNSEEGCPASINLPHWDVQSAVQKLFDDNPGAVIIPVASGLAWTIFGQALRPQPVMVVAA